MGNARYLRLVVQGLFGFLLVIALIFIPAGRLDYWQGWAFIGTTFVCVLIQIIAFARKPDVIRERMKPGPGTKWWDKVFYALYIPAFFAIAIVASLDGGRFRWTAQMSVTGYIIGYLVLILSLFLYSWAMWVNTFFSSTVRIQSDRGQEVVQGGPYRFVRHPGYVAGILMGISISFALGSVLALIPAGMVMVLLIIRTYLEDATLQKELSGYSDYTRKVRYRLLPGIW